MNVLILGSGGREHTFGWKLAQSRRLTQLFFAPGNAGTQSLGHNIDIKPEDFAAVKQAVLSFKINMVVVGPEAPLVMGIVDYFAQDPELKDVKIIGPSAHGAQLEGSKEFAKKFMIDNQIPTAKYLSVTSQNLNEGLDFLKQLKAPYVLKADGLAAGKGVLILDQLAEAQTELGLMLDGKFGQAGHKVVIEEYLHGVELSVFVLTDGISYVILPEAKDYKRIGIGDTGLNTGGMGAVSPVPFANADFMKKVEEQVVKPTIDGLKNAKIDYKGFVFIGLMNVDGQPFVIEYNVRMGDPETEVVIPRLETDLLDLFEATAEGQLPQVRMNISSKSACTVMLVSGGYPEAFEKRQVMQIPEMPAESVAFHAGTQLEQSQVLTNGGRVLSITTLHSNLEQAVKQSIELAEKVQYKDKYFRSDIGQDMIRWSAKK